MPSFLGKRVTKVSIKALEKMFLMMEVVHGI